MASDPVAPLVAVVCFLLAALAFARRWQNAAWLAAAGAVSLAAALAARGLRAGYWPLTGEYEFALAFALAISLAALVLGRRQRQSAGWVWAAVMLLATGLVVYARLILPELARAIRPLPPALASIWLPLHVSTAALAYGTLAVAGMAGLIWLVRESDRTGAEQLLDRAIAVGYPLLTLALIFGMIWAQMAWGRYWGWDLKEVWTLITWLVYTLYWHLHRRPGWQGRRVAWLALAGLALLLCTFLGVGWLARTVGLESLHLF